MNLFYMFQRKAPEFEKRGAIEPNKLDIQGHSWRGLTMSPGSRVVVRDIRRFASMRCFPDQCGWMIVTPDKTSFVVRMMDEHQNELSSRVFAGPAQPVWLPWPRDLYDRIDLVIDVNGEGKPAFLAVNRLLSRKWLYELAIGNGVEIGPGHNPQIMSDENRTVRYVEQMPPERWNELYNAHGKHPVRPELWADYIVGDAANLPTDGNSLDFIFGSHIFEHLVNPIGHLRLWHSKLAPGGKVICIVPDISGAKDDLNRLTPLTELLQEDAADIWQPQLHHYARFLRCPLDDERVKSMTEAGASIHTHFYDNSNITTLLEYAVSTLGFSNFLVEHTRNAKDFHFVLVK